MNLEERVDAVAWHGFTRRQARFLVTVMRHAGVCVPRQYAAFAGIAYGHKTNKFFDTLVSRRYAAACGCLHNRARLFNLQHRRLYEAIGDPHSRLRRPVSAARALERLMLLDAVLALPELEWLATEAEKVNHFTRTVGISPDSLPRATAGKDPSDTARRFPDGLPIGIESSGRVVIPYLVSDAGPDGFRTFLRRHLNLLRAVSHWTLRLVFPRPQALLYEAYQAVVHEALGTTSSRELAEAIDDGRGRVETYVIPHAYQHLSPLVARSRTKVTGVEKGAGRGATTPARSQPLLNASPLTAASTQRRPD